MRWRDLVIPVAIIVGCVALVQYHSIQFWSRWIEIGWLFSIWLEIVALFLWYQRSYFYWFLGLVGSAVVISGSLYLVSEPLFQADASRAAEERRIEAERTAITARRDVIRADVANLEHQLDEYLDRSEKRVGWAGRIDDTRERISQRRNELIELEERAALLSAGPGGEPLGLREQLVIGAQAVALVLFKVAAIIAIFSIRRSKADVAHPPYSRQGRGSQVAFAPEHEAAPADAVEPHRPPPAAPQNRRGASSPMGEEPERVARRRRAQAIVQRVCASGDISQARLAERIGHHPRDLSMLMNHERAVTAGGRTLSLQRERELVRSLEEMVSKA